jgi:hypothetical protein
MQMHTAGLQSLCKCGFAAEVLCIQPLNMMSKVSIGARTSLTPKIATDVDA